MWLRPKWPSICSGRAHQHVNDNVTFGRHRTRFKQHLGRTVRSLFIIDPDKKVRLIITYPASSGRNFDEILRVIDSLQLTDQHKVATPADWQPGEDVVIVPSLQDPEEIAARFPQGYRALKPYLRLTPQPRR